MSQDASALHVPHQLRDRAHVGDQYAETYNFSGPAFGQVNDIVIPSNSMVVRDVWIQFTLAAAGGPANPAYLPRS